MDKKWVDHRKSLEFVSSKEKVEVKRGKRRKWGEQGRINGYQMHVRVGGGSDKNACQRLKTHVIRTDRPNNGHIATENLE